jgi:sulfur-oxidizing protein SoxY
MKHLAAFLALTMLATAASAAPQTTDTADPLGSPVWRLMHERMLDGGQYVFDPRVQVLAPPAAENPANVPVMVRVGDLGAIRKLVVFADLNPIQKVLEYHPNRLGSTIGLRLKLEQASPVRAAVLTEDDVWHVGGMWVDAAGGGCSAPSAGRTSGDWARTLGQVSYRAWREDDMLTRLRIRVMHPMDTGLAPGIPAFYIDEIEIRDDAGDVLGRLLTYEPISENPFFTIDFADGVDLRDGVHFAGRDVNGNRFEAQIE